MIGNVSVSIVCSRRLTRKSQSSLRHAVGRCPSNNHDEQAAAIATAENFLTNSQHPANKLHSLGVLQVNCVKKLSHCCNNLKRANTFEAIRLFFFLEVFSFLCCMQLEHYFHNNLAGRQLTSMSKVHGCSFVLASP